MYINSLEQSRQSLELASRFAANFLYFGYKNLETILHFQYHLTLGERYYEDANLGQQLTEQFIQTSLTGEQYNDISQVLDYLSTNHPHL